MYHNYSYFLFTNVASLGVGWSGPPSFVSSSGPSSPGLSDPYSNSKESSEMSSSAISGDGYLSHTNSKLANTQTHGYIEK